MTIFKKTISILACFCIITNSYAAIISDNDGSAFVTKNEFETLKKSFVSQIEIYNESIDSKIDGAIAAYLAGINVASKKDQDVILKNYFDLPVILGEKDQMWSPTNRKSLSYSCEYDKALYNSTIDPPKADVSGYYSVVLYIFQNGLSNCNYVTLASVGADNFGYVNDHLDFRTKIWEAKVANNMWSGGGSTMKQTDSSDLYEHYTGQKSYKVSSSDYAYPLHNSSYYKFYVDGTTFSWGYYLRVRRNGTNVVSGVGWSYDSKMTAGLTGAGSYQGATGQFPITCNKNDYVLPKRNALIDKLTKNLFVIDSNKKYFYPLFHHDIMTTDADQSAYAGVARAPIYSNGQATMENNSFPDLYPYKSSTAPSTYSAWLTNFDTKHDNIIPTSILKWNYSVGTDVYAVRDYGGVPIGRVANEGQCMLDITINKTAGAGDQGVRFYFSKHPFTSSTWAPSDSDIIKIKVNGSAEKSYEDIKTSGTYIIDLGRVEKEDEVWMLATRTDESVVATMDITDFYVNSI